VKVGDLVRVCPVRADKLPSGGCQRWIANDAAGDIGVIVGPLVAGRYWQVFVDEQFLLLFQGRLEVIS
jgi:hypothetical protein